MFVYTAVWQVRECARLGMLVRETVRGRWEIKGSGVAVLRTDGDGAVKRDGTLLACIMVGQWRGVMHFYKSKRNIEIAFIVIFIIVYALFLLKKNVLCFC